MRKKFGSSCGRYCIRIARALTLTLLLNRSNVITLVLNNVITVEFDVRWKIWLMTLGQFGLVGKLASISYFLFFYTLSYGIKCIFYFFLS